jgi:hypothetical protein
MLSPLDRHALPLLDGTRDRDALVDALLPVVSMDRDALADYIDALPQHLAEMKLLRVD